MDRKDYCRGKVSQINFELDYIDHEYKTRTRLLIEDRDRLMEIINKKE